MEKKNKILLILGLIALLLFSGCSQNGTRNIRNFEFEDTNSSVENEKKCIELCMGRETEPVGFGTHYRCDYEPVICDGNKCLCKTY